MDRFCNQARIVKILVDFSFTIHSDTISVQEKWYFSIRFPGVEEEEELQASAAWKLAEQKAWVESFNVKIFTITTMIIIITIKMIFQATTT